MPTGGEDVRKRKDGRWEGRLLSPGGKRQSVDAKTQGNVQEKQKAKSALSRAGGRWENKDGLTGCRCNCRRGMLSVQHPAPDYRFAAFIFCVRHNIEGALDAPSTDCRLSRRPHCACKIKRPVIHPCAASVAGCAPQGCSATESEAETHFFGPTRPTPSAK